MARGLTVVNKESIILDRGDVYTVKALFEELAKGSEQPDAPELAEVARELGYRLPRMAPSELRELRAEIGAAREKLDSVQGSELCRGVLLALGEVAVAYGTEAERLAERRQVVVGFRSETLWADLLRELDGGPARPSELAELFRKDKGQISRALGALRDEGLVQSRSVPGDGRGALYFLTPEGSRTASALLEASPRPDRVSTRPDADEPPAKLVLRRASSQRDRLPIGGRSPRSLELVGRLKSYGMVSPTASQVVVTEVIAPSVRQVSYQSLRRNVEGSRSKKVSLRGERMVAMHRVGELP